jgi:hypothetical protein
MAEKTRLNIHIDIRTDPETLVEINPGAKPAQTKIEDFVLDEETGEMVVMQRTNLGQPVEARHTPREFVDIFRRLYALNVALADEHVLDELSDMPHRWWEDTKK